MNLKNKNFLSIITLAVLFISMSQVVFSVDIDGDADTVNSTYFYQNDSLVWDVSNIANVTNGDNSNLVLADDIFDFVIGLNYKTLTEIISNIGNWTADKSSYYTSTIIDTLGNWSQDKGNYYNSTEVLALNSSWDYTTDTNTNCSVDSSCSPIAYDSEINKTYVDAQDSAQDACSEITGCVENAITDGNTNWDNSYGFYDDIANFTGTLTNSKWCIYDGSEIDCNVEPVTDTNTQLSDSDILTLGYNHTSDIQTWVNANDDAGLTDLTDFDQTAWRLFYSNNLGDVIELSLGTDGQYLQSQGGTSSLTWSVPINTDTQDLSYDTATDIISLVDGGSIDITEVDTNTNANTICSGGTTYLDGEGNCDDISSVYEVQLNNEAGLYAVLSDVTQFWENGDSVTGAIGANEVWGAGWDADTSVPEKDDIYDWASGVTTTEMDYLQGVSSDIQTQLGTKGTTTLTDEASLYSTLSDVTQFYESGDKVGDADTLDTHDSTYFQTDLTDEASLYSALSDVTEFIETGDSATLATLDTGQGANELYDMNQNVQTTNNVQFQNITIDNYKYEDAGDSVYTYYNGSCVITVVNSTTFAICP